jgi:Asp-tRNA(Asn)/Glu-tRNA(Gln) amidotransferase C subunit
MELEGANNVDANTKEHVRILRHLSEYLDRLINKAASIGLNDPDIENEVKELNDIINFFAKTVEFDENGTDAVDNEPGS